MACLRILVSAVLLWSLPSTADEMDPLIGTWVSPDGFAKQRLERTFDGSWIETTMWFLVEDNWQQVASGAMYRRPGESHWTGVSRTSDMDGIELFETTLRRVAAGQYRAFNVAYQSDGTTMETEEDWAITDGDRFTYTIYQLDDGERTPWMTGEWVRE